MAYHRYHQVDTRIVRIFNTYGPRMRPADGRVVSNFIVQALEGRPITVYGDGSQSRSFCFVDDLIEGIFRLFQRGGADPVNIGNDGEFTVLELAEKVTKLVNASSSVVLEPLPVDDPKQRQPDLSLARASLDWAPTVTLDEGLSLTVEYFRQAIHA
jgi:nucleoside-diphosphate-sugar epimerase